MRIEDEIKKLGASLKKNPGDIDAAWNYWRGLGNLKGYDVRSGQYVVDAFGQAALDSRRGAIAFATAYRELANLTGDGPQRVYVNNELLAAIREAIDQVDATDKQLLEWVIESVETGAYEL